MAWALLFLTCDVYFVGIFLKLKCDSATLLPCVHTRKVQLPPRAAPLQSYLVCLIASLSLNSLLYLQGLCCLLLNLCYPFVLNDSFFLFSNFLICETQSKHKALGTVSNHCISLSLFPSPYVCISTIVFIIMTPHCNLSAYLLSHQQMLSSWQLDLCHSSWHWPKRYVWNQSVNDCLSQYARCVPGEPCLSHPIHVDFHAMVQSSGTEQPFFNPSTCMFF